MPTVHFLQGRSERAAGFRARGRPAPEALTLLQGGHELLGWVHGDMLTRNVRQRESQLAAWIDCLWTP